MIVQREGLDRSADLITRLVSHSPVRVPMDIDIESLVNLEQSYAATDHTYALLLLTPASKVLR